MKAVMNPVNTDNIEVSLTLTMTLSNWRDLMRQLKENYPSWEVGLVISNMLGKYEGRISPDQDISR